MKYENEITVETVCGLQELNNLLEKLEFKVMEEYDVFDIYMLDKNYNNTENKLELLKHCILIRDIVGKDEETKKITYKYKEYNEKEEIVKQGKSDCEILDIEEAKNLFEALNYEELIRINDHIIVYSNNIDELAVQVVNNKHIYIEIEEKCNYINKKYNSLDEMKNVVSKYKIPIKEENYFVKKAEIELEEKTKNKGEIKNEKDIVCNRKQK